MIAFYFFYLKRNFKDLDLLDQNKYASLCQAKEKIEGLVNNFSRIQYMSLDLTTGKVRQPIKQRTKCTGTNKLGAPYIGVNTHYFRPI